MVRIRLFSGSGHCKRSGGGLGVSMHVRRDGGLGRHTQIALRGRHATAATYPTVGHVDIRPGQGTAVAPSELANLNRDAVFTTPGPPPRTVCCNHRAQPRPRQACHAGRRGVRQCNRYPSNLGGRIGTSAEQVKVAKRDRKTKHIHNHGLVSLFTSYSLDVSP